MLFLSGPADMRGDGHALLAVFEHYMSDEPGTARNRMISTPSGAADASLAPDTAPALDATSQARQRLGAGQFDQAISADSALTQREAAAPERSPGRHLSSSTVTSWLPGLMGGMR
jgi:hypothetical protein